MNSIAENLLVNLALRSGEQTATSPLSDKMEQPKKRALSAIILLNKSKIRV